MAGLLNELKAIDQSHGGGEKGGHGLQGQSEGVWEDRVEGRAEGKCGWV